MKRTAFDEHRDQKVAEDYGPRGCHPDLMCAAHNCPNRWSVDGGNGRLCSAHAWAERHEWPLISEQQQWDETERARMNGIGRPRMHAPTQDEKVAILRGLAGAMAKMRLNHANPRAWVGRLQARAAAGEPMSAMQRHALQAVGQQQHSEEVAE